MEHFFDKYIIIAPGSDYGRIMWSDLKNNRDCIFIEYPISTTSKLLKVGHHIHFSFGINNIIELPLKGIWRRLYSLESIAFEDNLRYCIILPDVTACRMDVKYLEEIGCRNNIEIVLVNVNVVEKKKKLIEERAHCFSKTFSFDIKDCEKYGYVYHPTIYSRPIIKDKKRIKSDAFFIGTYTPERYKKLLKLHERITKNNGMADFHITGVPLSEKKVQNVEYNHPMSYAEVIERALSSNCIVEIMNPGQSGLTLRAMEAICLNKKLLTDNISVKQLDYYSKGFIRVCEGIDDSDAQFAIKREQVDYQYREDFSPNQLIFHIDKEFRKDIK